MLRTSSSTDSSTSLTQIVVEYDGVDDGSGRSGDSDRKYLSDAPKSMCPPTPLTLMLRMSLSTDSSTSAIVVEYDGVDDGGGRSGDFDRKFRPRLQ